jgi:hypothetical protein
MSGRVRRLAILLALACLAFPPTAAAQGALPAAVTGPAEQVTSSATQLGQAATTAISPAGAPPANAPAAEAPPANAPAAEAPPVEAPPVEVAPVEAPAEVQAPPAEAPPVAAPPIKAPPVEVAPVEAPAEVEAPSVKAPPVKTPPIEAAPALERVVHSIAPTAQPRTGNLVRAGQPSAALLAQTTRTVDSAIGAVELAVGDTLAGVGSVARTVDRRVRDVGAEAHRALAVVGGIGGSLDRVLDGAGALGGPVDRALGENTGIREAVRSVLAGFGRLTAPSTPGAKPVGGFLPSVASGSTRPVHSWTFARSAPLPGPQDQSARAGRAPSAVATQARAALAGHGPDLGWVEAPFASRLDGSLTSAGTPPAAGSTSHGTQGSDAPELPVAPTGASASASSALLFAGFVALFGAVALLLAGLTRRLHIAPVLLRPAPFISLPERPG